MRTVPLTTRAPVVKRRREPASSPTGDPAPTCSIADARQADADERAVERIETQRERQYQQALEDGWLNEGPTDLEASDGVRLVWSAVKGRPSYDMKAIREAAAAAGIDIPQFETTGQPSDRLDIRIADWRSDQQSETGE